MSDFWLRVDRGDPDGCWPWTGSRSTKGYGRYRVPRGRTVQAHRFAYESTVGPIPDGLVIDHLCRNRACCNPAHMEPVTNRENVLRGETLPAANLAKTHCPSGHEYVGRNVRIVARSRHCKTCEHPQRIAAKRRARARATAARRAVA